VVVSDVAAEMTAIAARRADRRDLINVTARTFGVEAIDAADGSFDVVLCREGLMFAVDPALAVREIVRVLRANGRMAVAVWGPKEQNPWLSVVFDALGAKLGRPVPPPGIPGPFALADAKALQHLLGTNSKTSPSARSPSRCQHRPSKSGLPGCLRSPDR
jgi:ubiquinone/menaquinone biosynthesis C-methylase UbiE